MHRQTWFKRSWRLGKIRPKKFVTSENFEFRSLARNTKYFRAAIHKGDVNGDEYHPVSKQISKIYIDGNENSGN